MKQKYKGQKIKISHPKSISEAINDIQTFLECDLYTKFRPEHIIPLKEKGKAKKIHLYREDIFMSEREFIKYIESHFDILRKEIIKLIGKKKFEVGEWNLI